jgi:Fe-S cluster assembly iron-binding protein IscA
MLTVTEAAVARLAQMLRQQGMSGEIAVRFVFDGPGLILRADTDRKGDAMFQYKGRTVLLLDPEVSDRLAEDTLDIEDSELMLQHPIKE